MANPYINKVVLGNDTLLDLTADTVTPQTLYLGTTAHDASGAAIVGEATGGSMVIRDTEDVRGGTIREITAGDVVQGTLNITTNGSYNVAAYADAEVSVSASPNLQSKSKTYTPTESQQTETITAGTGYDGLSSVDVTVNAISSSYVGSGVARRDSSNLSASGATVTAPAGYYASNATKTISSGSATPAASITATGASVSTGTNTLTLSKSVSNTPQVSAGYVSAGTAGNSSVSLTASITTKGAATITPTTTAQTIASGTYLTGAQTISGDPNLVAGNIKSGTTIFNVQGTYEGGGGALNLVHGTFTTGSTRATVESTTLAYTGTGYPVAAVVFVKGGIYNSTSAGDSTWYNSVNRYDVGAWYMTKSEATTAPIYDTAQTYTQGAAAIMYKNSTSDPTTYTQSAVKNQQIYTSSNVNPADGTKCVTFKGSGTNLAWYIGNLTSSTRGLAPDTEYEYYIIYSN